MRMLLCLAFLATACCPKPLVKPDPPPVPRCAAGPKPPWNPFGGKVDTDGNAVLSPKDANTLDENIRSLQDWSNDADACLNPKPPAAPVPAVSK